MNVRVAKGSELPRGWIPGMPLTVGGHVVLRQVQPDACPFGPECYACRIGRRWDPVRGSHKAQPGQPTRRFNRRAKGFASRSARN